MISTSRGCFLPLLLLLPCLLAILSSPEVQVAAQTGPIHNKVVVCYIGTWSVYRPGAGSFSLDNFDPSLCTHVIYAFAGLDEEKDMIKSLDPWQDLEDNYGKGGFVKLNKFKQTHPHLKVTLAIGGWNEGSLKYSKMAADPERRKRFVQHALEYVQRYGFDGLDLDWEYPTQRDGKPEDRENFSKLVIELKAAFKKYGLLLTSAIGAPAKIIDQAYEVKVLSNHLDFLHVMCYDYHGSWDKMVGPNAPLSSDDLLNVEYSIEHLINLGASPGKIVLGLPFYGRTFTAHGNGELTAITDEIGFQGPYTKENGFMGYNEVCGTVQNGTWELSWDPKTAQAYARQAIPDKSQTKVIAYDTSRSIANKVRFGVRQELAGFMVWSLDTDDFLGKCTLDKDTYEDFGNLEKQKSFNHILRSRTNKNFPLLRTINEAATIASEEWEKDRDSQNEIDSNDKPSAASTIKYSLSALLLAIYLNLRHLF